MDKRNNSRRRFIRRANDSQPETEKRASKRRKKERRGIPVKVLCLSESPAIDGLLQDLSDYFSSLNPKKHIVFTRIKSVSESGAAGDCLIIFSDAAIPEASPGSIVINPAAGLSPLARLKIISRLRF